MSDSKNLGEWIKSRWGSQENLAEKLKVSVSTVSAYKTGRINIPPKVQDAIKKLGYTGPWPDQEAQEATAPAGGPYLTLEAFAEWRGYWKAGMEGILERIERLEAQVRKLSPPGDKL